MMRIKIIIFGTIGASGGVTSQSTNPTPRLKDFASPCALVTLNALVPFGIAFFGISSAISALSLDGAISLLLPATTR